MTYKIWCKQRNQYFADGAEFESLEGVREQLIDYHSNDCDEESLNAQSLADILSGFEWEVHDQAGEVVLVEDRACHLCGSIEVSGGWCTNETCAEFRRYEPAMSAQTI